MRQEKIRRINGLITGVIILLAVIHIVSGIFQLMGLMPGGKKWLEILSLLMLGAVTVHAVLGVILTAITLKVTKSTKTSYPHENRMFWTRRISGFAMTIFIAAHLVIFMTPDGQNFRLHAFGGMELFVSLGLVFSLLIHLLCNLKPLLISFGAVRMRKLLADMIWIAGIVLLAAAAGFIVYYLRWNVLWR
ncbi:MAG: hypothetical protein Q4B15_05645 [Lachnospiraceae bacterium]|nr:hypothetical protein [Lachnospiraceae bacterium]